MAVGILDFQLREEFVAWREEVRASPGEATPVPAAPQNCTECVLSRRERGSHIVSLVKNTLTIVREFGSEHIIANPLTVDKKTVTAESRHEKARSLHFAGNFDTLAKVTRRLGQRSGIPQTL